MIDNDFLNSVWQHRRVVITKDCISFAFVGNDEEVDRVPLSGVDFVKVFDENISVENHEIQSQNHFCLQVATNSLGYNSGRSYMLRSVSSSSRDEVLVLLSKLSKDAKKRAKAKTGFQKLQLKTKKYYEKDFVQGFIALIIMTVSVTRPASPRLHFVSSSFLIAVSEIRASSAPSWRRSTPAASPTPTGPKLPSACSSCASTSSSPFSSQSSSASPPSQTGCCPSSPTAGAGSPPINEPLLAAEFPAYSIKAGTRRDAPDKPLWVVISAPGAAAPDRNPATRRPQTNRRRRVVRRYLFDAFVVAMSLVSLLLANTSTGIVRVMRALRVLRLFGRFRSLRKILSAVATAIVPVFNTFIIMFIIACICAPPRPSWAARARLRPRWSGSTSRFGLSSMAGSPS